MGEGEKRSTMKKQSKRNSEKFVQSLKLVYSIIILIASITSCKIPVMETQSDKAPEIITPDEPVIEPEKEKMIMMKPIKVYEKYAVDENNRVMGINGKDLELVFLTDEEGKGYQFNDFFVDGGDIYFQTKEIVVDDTDPENPTSEEVTHYYSQVDNEVSEYVSASDYPVKPIISFVEMGITPFSIKTVDNNGSDVSYVGRDTLNKKTGEIEHKPTGFKMIDGYCSVKDGLWFSVPETISIRLKGIYFYPVEGNLSANPV